MTGLGKILAIALVTLRSLVRSRVLVSLLALVLSTVAVLPAVIRGDGSIQGYARVAIEYTLRAVTYILAAATVWASVMASAVEIEERQIHLLATKPVKPWHIWTGKWLGLMALNALVLLIAGVCTCALIRWHLRPSKLSAEEREAVESTVLVARRIVNADQAPTEERIRKRLAALGRTQFSQEDYMFQMVRKQVMSEDATVPPGHTRTWFFRLGPDHQQETPPVARFNLSSPLQLELKPVAVEWAAGLPGSARTVFKAEVFAGRANVFTLPDDSVGPEGVLAVRYTNVQTNPASTIVFDQKNPVTVLVKTGSFEWNVLRALATILGSLAILAAVGLTMGCVLSLPVAVFASCAAILVFSLGSFVAVAVREYDVSDYRPLRHVKSLDPLLRLEFKLFDAVISPVRRFDVVPRLPRGEAIPWSLVVESVAVQVLLYCGIIGVAGSWLLRRRELGIPPA